MTASAEFFLWEDQAALERDLALASITLYPPLHSASTRFLICMVCIYPL